MRTGVSVIICCYNSASRIYETLRHLSLQKTPTDLACEIVLVDNASTDDTRRKASGVWKDLGRQDWEFKIVDQPVQGLAFAKEKGIANASFDTIIFCDDDNWLESSYLAEAHATLANDPRIGAIGGTGTVVSDEPLPDWFEKYKFCYACYAQGKSSGELPDSSASLYGAGMVIRHEVLKTLAAKNYSPVLTGRLASGLASGEDTELCYAIRLAGYKLWFSEKLKFYHQLPTARLSREYLYKINRSLALSRSNLVVYEYVLKGKGVTSTLWVKDMVYKIIFFGQSVLSLLNFTIPWFERRLSLAFSFYNMKGILKQFGKYRFRYQQIVRLKG